MWDNLGRVVAELPHLSRIVAERVEVVGEAHIVPYRSDGVSSIVCSGHFANWEILPQLARRVGLPCVQVYRAANNPLVDWLLRRVRRFEPDDIAPKGPQGARRAITALRQGRRLGMLIDQKMNDGIAVAFFGRDAMTAPAPAQLALRHHCPILPARLERLGGCHFRVTMLPPLAPPGTGDRKKDVATMMRSVNALFEDWIRARPGQWLWLHRRWPDS
jgi:Kdo2-lipid IVA lauroyltransferase/acyltransferase